jgi:NTP pyrophosphatase (non-canonical NTP hydrolase)
VTAFDEAVATLTARALEVRRAYATVEANTYGSSWTTAELTSGLVVDVGDLVRLVMARDGRRPAPNKLDQRIAHELADCLWAVLVLADRLGVDLAAAFARSMDELERQLRS